MANKFKQKIGGKVAFGLIVFVAIVAFPFYINLLKASPPPEPKLSPKALEAKTCVLPKNLMKSEHMQLLDVWRDTVVRDDNRVYVNLEGKEFKMSLSNTCLDCHSNNKEFCDACHNYASVTPYCYECHIEFPKEEAKNEKR